MSWNVLRRYTIQVFQEPTNKMETLLDIWSAFDILSIENLGEGRKKILVKKLDFMVDFVEFYTEHLFAKDDAKVIIEKKEIPTLKALIYYGNKATADNKGRVKVLLDMIRKESVKDLDYLVETNAYEGLIQKKLVSEKVQEADGLSISFDMKELERLVPFWQLIYIIQDHRG